MIAIVALILLGRAAARIGGEAAITREAEGEVGIVGGHRTQGVPGGCGVEGTRVW